MTKFAGSLVLAIGAIAEMAGGARAQLRTEVTRLDRVDIPTEFRGIWGTSHVSCGAFSGAERLLITARELEYYESTGFLHLAQVSVERGELVFSGTFEFGGEGEFYTAKVVIARDGEAILLSNDAVGEQPGKPERWVRCKSLPPAGEAR